MRDGMTQSRVLQSLALLLSLAGVSACASDVSSLEKDGDEVDAPVDGKLDGVSITDHGAFAFDSLSDGGRNSMQASVDVTLSSSERSHAWTFTLDGNAEISLETSHWAGLTNEKEVDTVIYLYKRTASGTWGRYVARNDDKNDSTVYSAIDRSLDAGEYRVVVKGYSARTRGSVKLEALCEGAGCMRAASGHEYCGQELSDVENNEVLLPDESPAGIRATSRPNAERQAQIIRAVTQRIRSARPITDWHTTLDMVDANSLAWQPYTVAATQESLILISFTKGDNLYGTFFRGDTTEVFAHLEDDEIVCVE